jgi:hypothetical protein
VFVSAVIVHPWARCAGERAAQEVAGERSLGGEAFGQLILLALDCCQQFVHLHVQFE